MASNPASTATRAAGRSRRRPRRARSSVAPRTRPIAGALNRVDGARRASFVRLRVGDQPAWPICADASAPSAWTASVSRRRPGTRVSVEDQGVAVDAAAWRDGAVGHGGHGGAAARDLGVEVDQLVA